MILFRDLNRSECLFGFNMEAVEWGQLTGPDGALTFYGALEDAAQIWTTIVWANFGERVMSQPLLGECSSGGITWV
jgi:hypothetical protein